MAVALGNIFILIVSTYLVAYIIQILFNKRDRQDIVYTNNVLNEMRTIPVKTLEQQKEFINITQPKKPKFKFSWLMIPELIKAILFYGVIGFLLSIPINSVEIGLGWGILFVLVVPMLFNLILQYFKLEKQNYSVWFKWK